jgi:hypothetical protein
LCVGRHPNLGEILRCKDVYAYHSGRGQVNETEVSA